jgi:hypothetical protein
MKQNFLIRNLIIVIMLMISIDMMGQANSYNVNSQTLYRHGYNSSGQTPMEAIDSVTTGGTTRYWVYPDLSLNPGYNPANPLTTPLTSTFAWTVTNTGGTASGVVATVGTYGAYTNYKQVTWSGSGTINLSSIETSGAGCQGTSIVTPVQVITAPNVTAISFSALSCPTGSIPYTMPGPTATLTISCAVNGQKQVSIVYNVTGPAGFTPVMGAIANLENSNTLDLSGINLTQPGTYTLTIVSITDRIATKSGLTAIADGISNTFILLPTPVTGPMYHVPNIP